MGGKPASFTNHGDRRLAGPLPFKIAGTFNPVSKLGICILVLGNIVSLWLLLLLEDSSDMEAGLERVGLESVGLARDDVLDGWSRDMVVGIIIVSET